MVKISSCVLTVALFATTAFSIVIPHNALSPVHPNERHADLIHESSITDTKLAEEHHGLAKLHERSLNAGDEFETIADRGLHRLFLKNIRGRIAKESPMLHKLHKLAQEHSDVMKYGRLITERQLETIRARDPNMFSLGRKLAKEGLHVAKSRKGRKVFKGLAKGAFEAAGFL